MKKKNIGATDKIVRLILAFILLLIVWFNYAPSRTMEIVLLVIAAVFALTSYFEYCPLYSLFGFSTLKNKEID